MQNTSCKSTCASHHSAVPLWCFLWWCGGVFVLLFFVVVFLWWCVCGAVLVLIFFCWCSRAGLFVVVFLWWCGRVCVVVFLCRWFGGGVVMFLCWCGGVFVVVFLWWCSCGGVCVVVLVWQTTRRIRKASNNFQRKSFQNEHFVRGFRNFSQKKLPKWSFRARLPPNFTEQASKTSVSRDASDNFHRKSFQKDRFARCFLQISQNKLPKRAFCAMLPPNFTERASKMIVSCEASSKFHRTMLPKRAFRAMLPTIFTKNLRFATVARNRNADSCERVHPPKAKCASHYSAVHSQMWQCAFRLSGVRKNVWIHRPRTDPLRAHKNVTFYYSFGRSTPRF